MPSQTPDLMPAHTPGGSEKGLAQPCGVWSWRQSLWGAPPRQQTLAMPVCWCKQRRCQSLPEGCSPKHHGLGAAPTPPNPTKHLPVAGPCDCRVSTAPADPGKIIRSPEHHRRWSAPGPAPPPFPRAGAGHCRLRLPRYRQAWLHPRECLIGLGRAETADRFPSPRRQIKRAGSTWRRPSPAPTCWCGEEARQHPVSLLSLLQLQKQTRESPEPRLPRRCHPRPHSPFSLLSNLSHLPRFEGAQLSCQLLGRQG